MFNASVDNENIETNRKASIFFIVESFFELEVNSTTEINQKV